MSNESDDVGTGIDIGIDVGNRSSGRIGSSSRVIWVDPLPEALTEVGGDARCSDDTRQGNLLGIADRTTRQFTYTPSGAFSLDAARASLQNFPSGTRPTGGGDGVLLALLSDDWRPAVVRVRQTATRVVADLVSGDGDPDLLCDQVARVLSLDLDGRPYDEIDDEVIAGLRDENPGLRPVLYGTPYEAAVWAVLSQRTRMSLAATIRQRLVEQHGTTIDADGQPFHIGVAPEQLLRLDHIQSVPAGKMPWLHAIARAALDGTLDPHRLRSLEPAEAISQLKRIDGIGEFSATLVLMRGAGSADVFPVTEPRLHREMEVRYRLHAPTLQTLRDIAEAWRPRRSWAGYLLRRTASA